MKLVLQIAAGIVLGSITLLFLVVTAIMLILEASRPGPPGESLGFRLGFWVGQNVEVILITFFWLIFVALIFVGYRAFIRKP